jgi:hypothetical protein
LRNEEVLQRVKEERKILHRTDRRKTKWIGYIMRRNCLLKHIIERKKKERRIEQRGRRKKRHTHKIDDLKERRG